uniref:Bifunctional inhibitor/plant lipid transfer protein/seed storage helical domain-containing protein n=1 Tax=Leersia perrieri TaxID=77586 RepID=A0A0D9X759_9ORYZ
MERSASITLAMLLLLAMIMADQLLPPASAQVFCRSQFNLANEACNMRATLPGLRAPLVPRQQHPLKLNETSVNGSHRRHGHKSRNGGGNDDDSDDGDYYYDDGDDDEQGGDEEGRGGERRRHRRHRRNVDVDREDPYDTACCRRLMALDNSCACQAAARLPAFMTAVHHVVRLTPVEGCHVTFECPGSF